MAWQRSILGKAIPRIDGAERVTGRAKYAGDWKKPGMLYARIFTSTIPHGKVLKMDLSKAKDLPGVHTILTCLDTKILWTMGDQNHQRLVFTDHVRFIGDCIGAVAAEDRRTAEEAAALVEVRYEEYKAVFTIEEAIKPDAPKLYEDGNAVRPIIYGRGDVEVLMKESDFIFEDDYKTARVHNTPLEPASSLAWWEEGKLTVVAPTQSITQCQQVLSQDLKIPIEKVRVIAKYKGGGFGNKATALNYDLMAAALSKASSRPVMVEYSRQDDFIGVHARWPTTQHYKAGVKKDGTLLAIDFKAYAEIGAYTRTFRGGKFLNGPDNYYNCPGYIAEINPIHLNTPATGHFRAPSGVQTAMGAESFVDGIADKMGIDPLEFRLKNRTVKFDCKYEYTTNGLEECLRKGGELIEWKQKWHHPGRGPHNGSRYHGIGVSIAAWHASLGKAEARLKLNKDGTLDLAVPVIDIGTGAKSIMVMIAADALGIPIGDVNLIYGDTDLCPPGPGEGASRTTGLIGHAVKAGAETLRAKILEKAAKDLGIRSSDLDIRDGIVCTINDPSTKLSVAQIASTISEPLEEHSVTDIKLPEDQKRYSFTAHFAELEVDVETGFVNVLNYIAVHDSGTIMNALTAESQVRGSIIMGLGTALTEEMIVDDKFGMISNPSLWSYRLPTQGIVPPIKVVFIDPKDPYGPKSLGEIGMVPVPALIGNAIFNATGARLKEIPMTPDRILKALGKDI